MKRKREVILFQLKIRRLYRKLALAFLILSSLKFKVKQMKILLVLNTTADNLQCVFAGEQAATATNSPRKIYFVTSKISYRRWISISNQIKAFLTARKVSMLHLYLMQATLQVKTFCFQISIY
jgi:hypothetical protein